MNRGRAAGFRIPRSRAGFTLIEMLVVICIIAVLTALVTVAITAAMSSARQSNTQVMVDTMSAQLAVYATRWGDFPPSTVADLGWTAPNDTNNGIEAFVACMSANARGGKLYVPPGEDLYSNTDKDKVGKDLKGYWYFGDSDLREVTDLNGFVIAYVHHKDYAKPRAGVTKYVLMEKGEPAVLRMEQSAATKTFVNPGRFQITSPGKDGKLGTPDDIRASQ